MFDRSEPQRRIGSLAACLALGLADKEIAGRLGISPKTVSNHVEHVYAKLGVSSRAAAALHVHHGLVTERVS